MQAKFTRTRKVRRLLGLTMSVAVAAGLAVGPPAASATEPCPPHRLTLTPPTQTQTVGQTATITATAKCDSNIDVGAVVTFKVSSGPNAGRTFTATTDSSGVATFTYTSATVGTDTVGASFLPPPEASLVTSNNVTVTWTQPKPPTSYTGYAYNAAASANVLGLLPINIAPINPIGPVDTTATTNQTNQIINVGGPIINAQVLDAGVRTGSGSSTAYAKTAGASVAPLLGLTPLISNIDVLAESSATCSTGLSGKTTIASLKIGNTVLVGPGGSLANGLFVPAPNTTINVRLGLLNVVKVVLNEQTRNAANDQIQVNAIRIKIGPLLRTGADLVVSHAESDIHDC